MENKEYIVTFPVSNQMTEYEWRIKNPTMKVTDKTTIGEITEFYNKHLPNQSVELRLTQITD